MSQPTLVIGNWKMKLSLAESVALAQKIKNFSRSGVRIAVCPSFTAIEPVSKILRGSAVGLGAQDMFWEGSGAFTGEVSPTQLKELGCGYVLIGHSERRQHLGETDALAKRKIKAAFTHGLTPVLCVGENLEQRQDGRHEHFVITQLQACLEGVNLEPEQELVIAYEPVWAIGTGQAISAEDVGEMQQVIRHTLLDIFSVGELRTQVALIYGGSVTGQNVASFTQLEGINGVLPGTASWTAESFSEIIKNAAV